MHVHSLRTALVSVITAFSSFALSAETWSVRTLAGPLNGGGYADGYGMEARLSAPAGIAACGGDFFVADSGNHVIRRVTPGGTTSTWAGTPRRAGLEDGARSAARFRLPHGLAATADCSLLVADTGNDAVRRVSPDGTVSTLTAEVLRPHDVAVDSGGNVFVIDGVKRAVMQVAPDGKASVVAASATDPRGLAIDSDGALLVIDFQGRAIKRRTPSGSVTTVVSQSGFVMDAAAAAGGTIYFTDHWGHVVRRVSPDGAVTLLAGESEGSGDVRDGTGADARFDYPLGIALAADGSLIVSDYRGCTIRRITTSGDVSTIAGSSPERAFIDGDAATTRFLQPAGLAVAADGTVFVADGRRIRRVLPDGTTSTLAEVGPISALALEPGGSLVVTEGDRHVVKRVAMDGTVTTIAGSSGQEGMQDGTGSAARFRYPYGVAVAADGTIFVADTLNRAIRTIVGNEVRTIRGGTFNTPVGIAVDGDNNAFVWDENLATLTRITPSGSASVVASGPIAGRGWGLARSQDGNLYLSANASDAIRRIRPDGTIEVFAGADDSPGNQNGASEVARFRRPQGVAVGPDGRIYVADTGNGAVRVIAPDPQPSGPRRRVVRR
ncbi:MAG TPA: NHL repeat-containing protein [Thermoanaerobaculia bacterium]|nr:NHL repeat-containing protein [Thermoanaerobaculia bacterium]